MSNSPPIHESANHVPRSVSQDDLREEPNEDVENVVDDRDEIPQGNKFFCEIKIYEDISQKNSRQIFVSFFITPKCFTKKNSLSLSLVTF